MQAQESTQVVGSSVSDVIMKKDLPLLKALDLVIKFLEAVSFRLSLSSDTDSDSELSVAQFLPSWGSSRKV
jgi:hypothetical protein